MKTVKETYDRAVSILREFSLPENILRVLDPDERPKLRIREHTYCDGRYYGNNESYYRATCRVSLRSSKEVTVVEVRQDFDTGKLREFLQHVTMLIRLANRGEI